MNQHSRHTKERHRTPATKTLKPLNINFSRKDVPAMPSTQPVTVAPIRPRFAATLPRARRNWAEELAPLRTRPDVWAMLGEFIKGTAGSLRKNRKLRTFTFYERCFPGQREAQLWARYEGKATAR